VGAPIPVGGGRARPARGKAPDGLRDPGGDRVGQRSCVPCRRCRCGPVSRWCWGSCSPGSCGGRPGGREPGDNGRVCVGRGQGRHRRGAARVRGGLQVLIAFVSGKGAPGTSTSALALALAWPRPVLLAECDPRGGDLVWGFGQGRDTAPRSAGVAGGGPSPADGRRVVVAGHRAGGRGYLGAARCGGAPPHRDGGMGERGAWP